MTDSQAKQIVAICDDLADEEADDICPMCCGDGVVMLSDCGPSEWGEDCLAEEDDLVNCPECRRRARVTSHD